MSYQGFGYPGYSDSAAPDASDPAGYNQTTSPANANVERGLQSAHGWPAGQSPSGLQPVNQTTAQTERRSEYWQQAHTQRQQQTGYRNVGAQQHIRNTGQSDAQTRPTGLGYGNQARSDGTASVYLQDKPRAQNLPDTTASPGYSYQSQSNGIPMEQFNRPATSERAKEAAASAMTALSSTAPSRPYNRDYTPQTNHSNSVMSNQSSPSVVASPDGAYPDYPSQSNQFSPPSSSRAPTNPSYNPYSAPSSTPSHSTVAPRNTSPQLRRNSPNMVAAAASRANSTCSIQSQQQSDHHSTPQARTMAAALHSKQLPTPVADHRQTASRTYSSPAVSVQATSQPQTSPSTQSQSPTTLPNFVDPSQIYNPYHLELRAAKERQLQEAVEEAEAQAQGEREAAETAAQAQRGREEADAAVETQRQREAEAEARRSREKEEQRKRDETEHAEDAVRRHLGQMEQESNSRRHTIGYQPTNMNMASEGEPTAPESTPAPPASVEPIKKRRGGRPKGSKNKPKADGSLPKPGPKPKRKSEPASTFTHMGLPGAVPAPAEPAPNGDANASAQSNAEEEDVDMAAEMQAMIAKMKKFKSMDPETFNRLWSDLKKDQVAKPSSSSSPEEKSTTPNDANKPEPATSPTSQSPITHTTIDQVEQPASTISADSPDEILQGELGGFPDFGRFPSQRCRRQSKMDGPDLGKFPMMRRPMRYYNKIKKHSASSALAGLNSADDDVVMVDSSAPSTPVSATKQAREKTSILQALKAQAAQPVHPVQPAQTGPPPKTASLPSAGQNSTGVKMPLVQTPSAPVGRQFTSASTSASASAKQPPQATQKALTLQVLQAQSAQTTGSSMPLVQKPSAPVRQSDPTSTSASAAGPPQTPSQSIIEPPSNPAQRNNMWPEAKRLSLAEAACIYINGLKHNSHKPECRAPFIMSLIERNPTYIEICGLIESSGYYINRVHFAKHLLTSVPDLSGTSNPGGTPQSESQGQAPPSATPQPAVNPTPLRQFQPPQAHAHPPLFTTPQRPPPPVQQAQPLRNQAQPPRPEVPAPRPSPAVRESAQQQPPTSVTASTLLQQFQTPQPAHTPASTSTRLSAEQDDAGPMVVDNGDILPPSPGPTPSTQASFKPPPGPTPSTQAPFKPPPGPTPSTKAPSNPPQNSPGQSGWSLPPHSYSTPYPAQSGAAPPTTSSGFGILQFPQSNLRPAPSRGFTGTHFHIPDYTGKPLFGTLVPPGKHLVWTPRTASQPAQPFMSATQLAPPNDGSLAVRYSPMSSGGPVPHPRHVSEGGRPIIPAATPTPGSYRSRSGSKLNPKLRVPAPPPHKPAPGSKEEKARKRNFAEIVDLSVMSDDEDTHSSKTPRLESTPAMNEDTSARNKSTPVQEATPSVQVVQSPQQGSDQPATLKQTDLSRYGLTSSTGKQDALRRRPDLAMPLKKGKALRKTFYNSKTIGRDVLIATGRHPAERALNHHLSKLKGKFEAVDNNTDLETFRWNVVDPGGPLRPETKPEPLLTRPLELTEQTGQTALAKRRPRDRTSAVGPGPSSSPSQSRSSRAAKKQSSLRTAQTALNDETAKPSSFSVKMPPADNSPSRRRVRQSSAKQSTLTSSATPTTRHKSQVQVVIPGRTTLRQPSSSAYAVYECHWQHCNAKLHNLVTLRKHLLRMHVPEDADAEGICQWEGCEASAERKTWTKEQLSLHLEGHVREVAWIKGEGPNDAPRAPGASKSDPTTRPYLFDRTGRSVTPCVSMSRGQPPTIVLPAAPSTIRSFHRLVGIRRDEKTAMAEEVLRAMEARMAQVGVGVYKGGCTLMNDKRRETVRGGNVREVVPAESFVISFR